MSAIDGLFVRSEALIIACGHGDTVNILSGKLAGQSFVARLDTEPKLESDDTVLGASPMMQCVLRCQSPAPAFGIHDLIEINGRRFKVLERDNTSGAVTTDFWLEQQI